MKEKLPLINWGRFYFSKGVSFTEVLIAFFMITVALVVFLNLAANQLRVLRLAEERLAANTLALEGIELVQAYRNSQINQNNWLGSLNQKGRYCIHFPNNNFDIQKIENCNNGRLYLINGRYLHNFNINETIFRREIQIQDALDPNKTNLSDSQFVKVLSIVQFRGEEVKLETILTKWHPLFL